MSIRTSTLLLTTLAAGVLASAYLIGPAPAATALPVAAASAPVRQMASVRPLPPAPSTIKIARAPVPLLTRTHDSYFDTSALPPTQPTSPLQDARTSQNDPSNGAMAKASIERDGYRNVSGLVKSGDGTWRGHAMRGNTEIAVLVDASGGVTTE